MNIPAHLQADFDALNDAQKAKFRQLMQWTNPSGLQGVQLPVSDAAFDKCLQMVKNMGEEPVTPAEPDRTVNHDWPFKYK
jgi:hypothetical protein